MSNTTGDKVYSGIAEYGKIQAGIGLVISIIIFIIFLLIGIFLVRQKEIHTQKVSGKIEEATCGDYDKNSKKYSCGLTVSYTINGITYKYSGTKEDSKKYSVGSQTDIYVNPEDYNDIVFQPSYSKTTGWFMIGIAFFIIIFSVGNFYLTTKYKGYAAFSGASSIASSFGGRSGGIGGGGLSISPFSA